MIYICMWIPVQQIWFGSLYVHEKFEGINTNPVPSSSQLECFQSSFNNNVSGSDVDGENSRFEKSYPSVDSSKYKSSKAAS